MQGLLIKCNKQPHIQMHFDNYSTSILIIIIDNLYLFVAIMTLFIDKCSKIIEQVKTWTLNFTHYSITVIFKTIKSSYRDTIHFKYHWVCQAAYDFSRISEVDIVLVFICFRPCPVDPTWFSGVWTRSKISQIFSYSCCFGCCCVAITAWIVLE